MECDQTGPLPLRVYINDDTDAPRLRQPSPHLLTMAASYTFTVTIECDRCGVSIESNTQHPEDTPVEAIDAFMASEGWGYDEDGQMVCPRCCD